MKVLLVELSEQCNLDCSYCDVNKRSKLKVNLDHVIDQYKSMRSEFPDEKIKIDFFGGEPTLQMDRIKAIIDATEHDPNIEYYMPTNGLTLTQELANYLMSRNVRMSLSFDGLWQDDNRKQLSGNGTLTKYMAKSDLFRSLPMSCHTMITKGNYNLLENHLFIRDLIGKNPDQTLVRDRNIWDNDSVEKLKVGITELFDWYKRHPEEEMPGLIKHYLSHIVRYKYKKVELDTCGAGEKMITVADEDKVLPCVRFKNEPDTIASIPIYTKMSECETCEVRHYCKKGCLYEQIHNGGPIKELCDIYKYIYSEEFSMIKELKNNQHFVSVLKKEIMDA